MTRLLLLLGLALVFALPGDWVAEKGAFEVRVGASSRDTRLKGTFSLVD